MTDLPAFSLLLRRRQDDAIATLAPMYGANRLGIHMHRIATVQTRGRITLPTRVRQRLQIAPGDNVVFVETAAGRFELKAEARTAALLNRRPTSRLDVPVRRATPQLQLPLRGSEHPSAASKNATS